MNVTELVLPIGMVAVGFIALLKIILWQNEKRQDERFAKLDERFAKQETDRAQASEHWDLRYGQTEQAVKALAERLAHVETSVTHMPGREEITQVREGIARISAENQGQTDMLRQVMNQVRMFHEWMMRNN
jgi:sugar-specific transcriptional regulator TrmB